MRAMHMVGRLCIHRCIYLQICLTREKMNIKKSARNERHRVKYRAHQIWRWTNIIDFFLPVSAPECIHIPNRHVLYWRLLSIFRYASVNMSGIMAKAARRRRLMNFCLIITTTPSTDNGTRRISSCGWHFSRLLMNSFWMSMTFVMSQHYLAFRFMVQCMWWAFGGLVKEPIRMTF